MQYSTFMPGPMMGGPAPPMAPQVPLNSSTAYLASSGGQGFPPPHLNGSLPMSSRTQVSFFIGKHLSLSHGIVNTIRVGTVE